MSGPPQHDSARVAALRAVLPATGAGIYLDTASAGPLPSETAEAMREREDWEVRVGRAGDDYWADSLERMDEARAVLAALLGADVSEVALTHGSAYGMAIAGWAPRWRAGDRAVTTNQEHPSLLGVLHVLRDRFGVELDFVDVTHGDEGQLLEAFESAIGPRTKLVAISHVTWTTGSVLPLEGVAELARRGGAWYAVDGAQAAGAIPVDVAALDADFYTLPAHRWLCGPEGNGALRAGPRALAEAAGVVAGTLSFESVGLDGQRSWWRTARRFEASDFHRPSVVAFARTVGWLEMYVGLAWAYERSGRLARRLAQALAAIDGVEVLTPAARMATIVAFRIAGWSAAAADEELSRRVFAILRVVPPLDALRASVAWFNTEEELGRFVETVALLAAHTPDSLPRRPTLVVLRPDEVASPVPDQPSPGPGPGPGAGAPGRAPFSPSG